MTRPSKLLTVAIVPMLLSLAACGGPVPRGRVGGDYGPVTRSNLIGEHVCSIRGMPPRRFRWAITTDRFEITEDGEPIPRDVLDTIIGKKDSARAIEGKWELADQTLTLSEIQTETKSGYENVQLRPFRTPVVRVYFGEAQYVLGGS